MACKYILNNKTFNSKEELKDYFSQRKNITKDVIATFGGKTSTTITPYKNTDQWVGLATRRVLQMAAQEGYDGVSFATGQQSADMYSLSNQVDKINIEVVGEKRSVEIFQKNNKKDTVVINKEGIITSATSDVYKDKRAEDVLGKDLTKKILGTAIDTTLEGEGLEFGGEGMKTFYDNIVTKVAQKEAQRFDRNAKLEEVNFDLLGSANKRIKTLTEEKEITTDNVRYAEIQKEISDILDSVRNESGSFEKDKLALAQQPFIAITDKMRSELKRAIPMFSRNQGQEAPKEALSGVTDRLKESGLAKNVYQMTNSEIEAKLSEFGANNVDKTTAGFAHNGDVYLNTDIMGLDTPIHEFGHLHLDWLKENKKDIYKAGLSLINTNKKEAQKYIDIVKETQPNLEEGSEKFINEVLAQIIGDQGAKLVQENKKSSISEWLKSVWEAIKDVLGLSQYTAEQVANMTLAQFGTASAKDMLSGRVIPNVKVDKLANFKESKLILGLDKELASLAESYKKSEGLGDSLPNLVLEVSQKDAIRLADAYDQMKHSPENTEVKKGYAELVEQTRKQANILIKNGYKFQLAKPGEGYNSDSSKMVADVRNNKHIFIDPSSENYGTTREFDSQNIGLADSGFKDINGVSLTNVEVVRAVHDIFGHAEYGTQFGAVGEENAWRVHMNMFTPLAQKALTATTRGQNSWVNFGPHMRTNGEILKKGDEGYLSANERPFAEQKIGFLPEWATDNSYGDTVTINGKEVKPSNKYIFAGEEVYEITDGKAYYDAILAAKNSRLSKDIPAEKRDGIQVFVDTVDNYQDMIDKGGRLLVSKDGLVGVKIEVDGNIGSGFSHLSNTKQNALLPFLVAGIKMGARYTNCYDTYLPKYYAKFGFVATGRMAFEPSMAEKGWQNSILKNKPDVVFMKYDGGDRTTIEDRIGTFPKYEITDGKYIEDYEEGEQKAREESVKEEKYSSLLPIARTEVKKQVTKTPEKPQPTFVYEGAKIFSKDRINPITGKNTGQIELDLLQTEERDRGQGYAKEALSKFLEYTDVIGKDVYLVVVPRDLETNAERLKELYKSFGFKETSEFEMVRKAQDVLPEDFDNNGEPSIKMLLEFSSNTTKKLSNTETAQAHNTAIALRVKSSVELRKILEDTFVKNGIVSFSKEIMSKNGYNIYEIDQIQNSPELQKQIKEAIMALRNTEDFILDYDERFASADSSEIGLFGKQIANNPYVAEIELAQELAGVNEDDVTDSLTEDMASQYTTDPNFKKAIDTMAKDYRNLQVMAIENGGLVEKKASIEGALKNGLIDTHNEKVSQDIDDLANGIEPRFWNTSKNEIYAILKRLGKEAVNNGIDLQDIYLKVMTKSRAQILQFFSEMETMLENPTDINIKYFSEVYGRMFDLDTENTRLVKTNSKFDIVLDTNLSEYELFDKFGLVKKQEGIYRKTTPKSLEELYNAFFANTKLLPKEVTSLEELQAYVQKNLGKLEVSDFQVDTDNLEKVFLYKKFFKFGLSTQPASVKVSGVEKITLDEEYLKKDFVQHIGKWILETQNKNFKITENGIELVNTDPISKAEAILTIPQDWKEDFAQYDNLSKTLNLGLEQEDDVYQEFNREKENRLEAINNPNEVPKIKGEYSYIEGGVLAAKNEANNIVRTPIGIFEMSYQSGNVKFFNKLTPSEGNYKTIEAEKPFSDIDYKKYTYLETTPEVFKHSKEYYSKAELKQINDDYFGCQ